MVAVSAVWGQSSSALLLYSSAKAGPNQGWARSPIRGAAVSIWGKNFGGARGSSFVKVGGMVLTNDSDYAEWGATTNPTTAKGFQRITFWLNSSMPAGDTTGISVTVNGVQSNTLPFKIDNTGVIRFVDGTNGNDSWDGLYPDNSLGGSQGPWKTPFMYLQRPGTGPGAFFYMRGGTYTAIFDPSSGHPAQALVGYFEEGGTNCNVYYPTIDGTDALRYTVTSYPGELATFLNAEISNMSSYWTLTNFRWTATTPTWTVSLGNEWSMCADCQRRSTGLDIIGMQFDGTQHHVVHSFGDNFHILANYIDTIPVTYSSFDITTSYPLYLSGGDGLLVADNEIHGGAMYSIHHYDEYRCSASNDTNRYMTNSTFDSNLFDMTRSAVTPTDIRAGILTGSGLDATANNVYATTAIKNNIFFSRDNLVSEAALVLFSSAAGTYNGVHVYNNTIDRVPSGASVFYDTQSTWQNVDFTNNIFSEIGSYELYVDGGSAVHINPTLSYNLVGQAPRINGNATVGNNVVGLPAFVNAPADFHLQASSPAINAGEALSSVTQDYEWKPRPRTGASDIGALVFVAGKTQPRPVRPGVTVCPPSAHAPMKCPSPVSPANQ